MNSKKTNTLAKEAFARFRKNKLAVISLFVILIFVAFALFPSQIAPYGYDEQNLTLTEMFLPPSGQHLFGTDNLGRDIFSRTVYATRYSLTISLVSVAIATLAGLFFGSLAGYYGGRVDNLVMRFMDILSAIPNILLAMAIVAALGPGMANLIAAISISFIPQFSRLVRSSILSIKGREFVAAARSNGASDAWILRKHIFPNILAPLIVEITNNLAMAILMASSLSFIGLGLPSTIPEWGSMLSAGRNYFRDHWFVATFPGLAIMLSVFAFNLFGDGLRDALDPKQK